MRRLLLCVLMAVAAGSCCGRARIVVSSSSFVADREFPRLLPYVWDGWDLKFGLGPDRPYRAIVAVGGTLHVCFRNDTSSPVTLDRVQLEGIDLSEHIVARHREYDSIRAANYLLNDETSTPLSVRNRLDMLGAPTWYGVRPNPVPPGAWGELVVRLRKIPRRPAITVSASAANGLRTGTKVALSQARSIAIASFGFSENGDRLLLHLRSDSPREFRLRSVALDGKSTASPPAASRVSSLGILPVELPLSRPWPHGSFHHIAIETDDGARAEAVVRARDAFFALGMWGYRNRGNSLEERTSDTCAAFAANGFNTHMGMGGAQMSLFERAAGLNLLRAHGLRLHAREPNDDNTGSPDIYARFLVDEPDAHDASLDRIPGNRRCGSFAQALVARHNRWTRMDPRSLNLLNVDLTYKPENWWAYGQVPDILALDPYYQMRLADAFLKHPGWVGRDCTPFFVYACSEIARWAAAPNPTHVILNAVSWRDKDRQFRYGTPEEKRVEFYHALAAGAKGVSYWWFTPCSDFNGCGSGEPAAEAMLAEMKRLNVEANAVAPLLAAACPAVAADAAPDPFTTCTPAWLMPRTLFAGPHTALVILVNRDHSSDVERTRYEPIEKSRVWFLKPPWMGRARVLLLDRSGVNAIEHVDCGSSIEIPLRNFALTGMLVFTDDAQVEREVAHRYRGTASSVREN